MFSNKQKKLYYQAVLEKQPKYEGLFYFAVKTTGTFCRSTCPARKPKFENCEFFSTVTQAQFAGYRPCRRCHPLALAQPIPSVVQILMDAVEQNPSKRWRNEDLQQFSIDASTAQRQFKKRFGMTFIEYARTKRISFAAEHINAGKLIIDAQFLTGYESSSGFRNAFSRIIGNSPSKLGYLMLKSTSLETRLGTMLVIADDKGLYSLQFVDDYRDLKTKIERFKQKINCTVVPGETSVIRQVRIELDDYFSGKNLNFTTPICLVGSLFQKSVWKALRNIVPGETRSFSDIAHSLEKATTFRSVLNARNANQFAIIIPCHRVVYNNGALDGEGKEVSRKQWLIEHENEYKT